ncbi:MULTISPECIES: hypothetical protein [unclassified Clostridioides]|uniref:hypothetical protein n=1 Tax=unclassified Clostridioides TaxID=2635829 RepID=UPI001D0C45A0|nr:hypothetical protein [Clostridioides sp. ES-S-0001-02]MCC0642567.1 hypothetical protein [Clostridioides sp. ES-S-0049-03]MCC0653517.1 hypothetical protein [Clostridioides sp. ES-S-0001-03]MCC0670442.1 hypothetical protein [Clostridioides sp. ES-S-0145-01]MCC0679484.1 hypothetical protein [Clostridioides sp. ES-S-0005-03]MCC0702350.1 hypothetical protein [Clostridioides sp. ES-S-0049-02]MCC0706846.1 hypothetical protein [Clostridioides sp. ES-S-0190-01]MCC0765211.1 hypothetical protein [Cl
MPKIEKDLDGTTTITYFDDDVDVPTDDNGYKISMTVLHGNTVCHVVSPETTLGRKFTIGEKQDKDDRIYKAIEKIMIDRQLKVQNSNKEVASN